VVAAVHDHTDDDLLAARLGAALERGLDEPVEVTGLLAGARTGARRIRRRRRTGVAVLAVLAVAAVPSGLDVLGPHEQAAQVATSPPSEALSTAAPDTSVPAPPRPSATRPPTQAPTGSPGTPAELVGKVTIPEDALLAPRDLPIEVAAVDDHGHYLRYPTLTTSLCGDEAEPGEDAVIGGRETGFREQPGSEVSVITAVRVFDGDGARQSMDYQLDALGRCTYAGDFTAVDASGLPGDQALLAVDDATPYPDTHYVLGAVRLGGTTVAVAAVLHGSVDEVVAAERQLLERAAGRLAGSGLPAAHPGH
jgi:hypothetical protein